MKSNILQPWIEEGYKLFAVKGPNGVKVEVLSRIIKKNKSSFYHHFADLEIFIDLLLMHHLKRAEIIAIAEQNCKNVIPELINVLLDYKTDLLFNRQLRIHRNIKKFKICFEASNSIVGDSILKIWAEMLDLNENSYLADLVLRLTIENFYLQITEDNLNYGWLVNYMNNIGLLVKEFKNNHPKQSK